MASVPMKLPSTTLFAVPAKPIRTPSWRLPEITLRAAAVVPPMVLLWAPIDDVHAVVGVGHGGVARDVGADEVVRDRVAVGAGVADVDAPGLVARDHVVVAGCRVADEVVGGLAVDQHAVLAVAQRGGPVGVDADEVVLDEVLSVSKPVRLTPLPVLPEMTFAGPPPRPMKLSLAAEVDGHAVAGVGQGVLSGLIGADVDARDLVRGGHAAGDQDAVAGVVRDDLGGRRGAADDVVGRAEDDGHAAGAVAVGAPGAVVPVRAGDVGADGVALDDVVGRVAVGDVDAVALVAQDDVAGGGRRPADRVVRGPLVDDDAAAAAAVLAVAQGVARVVHDGRAGVVRPDDRAADHVLGGARPREDDAVVRVGRDDVAREDVPGGRAVDVAIDRHAVGAVALVDDVPIHILAGRVGVGVEADIVVVEDDVRGVVDEDAAGVEPVDGQGLDLRAGGGDVQSERPSCRRSCR